AAEDAIAWVLSDAATRGVLLAVVGPRAQPPSGATLVLRIDEESRPPDVFAANQLFQLNAAIEAHIGRVAHPVVYAADLSLLQAEADAGRYVVTEAGQRAWQVVRALSDRKPPSLLISKS